MINLNQPLKVVVAVFIGIIMTACSAGNTTNISEESGNLIHESQQVSCSITGVSESIETVYNYNLYHTNISGGDYSDNPVRPFITKQNNTNTVNWFASNSKGYCKSYGLPTSESVPDILAQIRRVVDPSTGMCEPWVTSRFNATPNQYTPDNYYNELWMVVPYTNDGINVMALIHNEYHIVPNNITNVYGNLIGATSTDAANSFDLYQSGESNNIPVIAAPYPYNYSTNMTQGKGGMFAQTNIIKWGNYYYMLVNQVLSPLESGAPNSLCIYRTNNVNQFNSWRAWDQLTNTYDVPLVPAYPSDLSDPEQYLCSPIPGLSANFHYSWSYNVLLHKFILVGIYDNYNNTGKSAFVYTLANLNPISGVLTAADGTNNYQTGFLQYVGSMTSWQNSESTDAAYYPSILDPQSPQLSDWTHNVKPGDLNFQHSGQTPYIYYTYFHPRNESGNANGQIRDIDRQKIIITCQ